jgi:hypothetical protein
MFGTIGLWRILFVFSLTSISNMTWFQGLKAIDPSGACNVMAGFASNAGMVVFGSYVAVLAMFQKRIPADRWHFSLMLVVVINLSQPIWLAYADRQITIISYSILQFITNTLLASQVTVLTIAESSSFPHDRRGGSLGYGLAYGVASTLTPWLAIGIVILCALALLALNQKAGVFAKPQPSKPSQNKSAQLPMRRIGLIFITMFLFAMLSASSRIYESFSAGLIGTWQGVGGVALLVVLEWILLPKLDKRYANNWIFIALAAWPVAYLLLLQDGWLQVVAIACVSANCCGQTVLQEQLQSTSKPGSSQLQATMSLLAAATAAVVSYFSLRWTEVDYGPIWLLGLIAATLAMTLSMPALLINTALSDRTHRAHAQEDSTA